MTREYPFGRPLVRSPSPCGRGLGEGPARGGAAGIQSSRRFCSSIEHRPSRPRARVSGHAGVARNSNESILLRLPARDPSPNPLPQGRAIAFEFVAHGAEGFLHAEPRRTRRFKIPVGATGRAPVSLSHRDSSHQSGSSPARATCRSPLRESSLPPRLRVNTPDRRAKTTRRETANVHMQRPCPGEYFLCAADAQSIRGRSQVG